MKYIAIFDIPDDCTIGCAVAKIAKKGKEEYTDKDFTWIYADVEPLAKDKEEVFDRFKTVERVLRDAGISCAYDMPGFWSHDKEKYHVIATKYHKGYQQALTDVEKEIRKRFGFAEMEYLNLSPFHDLPQEPPQEVQE
ncbi:MAG: hypothetical protein J6S14_12375 [Clostridia bacterium]|nr:hypothetical protein [Clostridia bacterium]